MLKFMQEAVANGSSTSSARVINMLGAITASCLLIWDTVANSSVRGEAFGMYLAYCAGVYSYGKKLDKESKDEKSN
jgi:hypothetical protein